jgi:hypothetical protein
VTADCEVAHYEPDHLDGVLEVLSDLWPYDRDTRARLFKWKYLENPFADRPLGIVALDAGRVVGFRGYLAERFMQDGNGVGVLHPGDTCVSLSHRNRGLSVAMGELAMQYDTAQYRFFLNLACSKSSLPGYLALGFRSLAPRVQLQHRGRNPLRWAVGAWAKFSKHRAPLDRIRLGRSGRVLVTDAPRPESMAAVIAAERHEAPALQPMQDRTFFEWRYRNPANRYLFYHLAGDDRDRGYLVVDVSPNGRSSQILDFGARDDDALSELLAFVCESGDFMALSVLSYCLDARLLRIVQYLGFVPVHAPRMLLRRGSVEELALPVLIRPIAKSFGEESFRIGALDMRRLEHWRLKPICSDGA